MSIKVLFFAADPFRQSALALPEEARRIENSIRVSRDRGIDFHTQWAVRVTDLQTALLHHHPEVVHFSGHGTHTRELILESDTGQPFTSMPEACLYSWPHSRVTFVWLS
jgi:hypothetical protein